MPQENDLLKFSPYWRWLDKKLGDKSGPIETLQRRTMNTATTILTALDGVPFEKLSSTLYFFCADVEAKKIARMYESQLELAGAAPEKFAKGLHRFFNDTERYIRENDLYEDFFDFLHAVSRERIQKDPESDAITTTVIDCYFSLLLQQSMYTKPDKFDLYVITCGMDSSGNLITVPDAYPRLDLPAYTIERLIRDKKLHPKDIHAAIERECKRHGMPEITNIQQYDQASYSDRAFTNIRVGLLPFINEFNCDIVPQTMFNTYILPLYYIHANGVLLAELEARLTRRNRAIPANGVKFEIREGGFIQSVLLREVLYDETIYMLYRVTTSSGDLAGYYDTKGKFLFSALSDTNDPRLGETMACFLLYLYACATLKDGPRYLEELPNRFSYQEEGKVKIPFRVEMFLRGGKPKPVYSQDGAKEKRLGDERFESVERQLSGFVRKVGPGRTPSDEAIAYAESLGLFLEADETYVRPFTKRVLRLKAKPSADTSKGEIRGE